MARAAITGRLGRLERTERTASAPRCRCCAGIDFATGSGAWDPPSCILLRNDDGTAIGWCKRCSKAIRAVVADKPFGEPGPWRVARATWGELPV